MFTIRSQPFEPRRDCNPIVHLSVAKLCSTIESHGHIFFDFSAPTSSLHECPYKALMPRVHFSDRTGLTVGLRYRFTGPVKPVTGRNRTNANLNSNFAVVAVVTGKPAGYTGLPAGFADIPAGCASRFLTVYRPGIPVYRPVLPVYRLFRAVFRRLKNGSPV